MPARTPKACRVRGCASVTVHPSGFCDQHVGEGWRQHNKGQTSKQRGYGPEWRTVRNAVIKRDKGLCQECKREGIVRPGTSVDHIIAKAHGGSDAPSNLECICTDHHRAKTARERLRC